MNTRPASSTFSFLPRAPPTPITKSLRSRSPTLWSTPNPNRSCPQKGIIRVATGQRYWNMTLSISCARWISRAAQILDMCLRRPSRLLSQGALEASPHQKPHQSSALLVLPMLNCNSHRYHASSWLCSSERTEIHSSSPSIHRTGHGAGLSLTMLLTFFS